MAEILKGTNILLVFGVVAIIMVLVAMMADLVSGLYKAKMRGEFTKSELLKRTGSKFILYEGSMLIALCIDLLIHFTHLYEFVGLPDVMVDLPLIAFVVAIFWCIVEALSIREKAEDKTRVKIREAERIISLLATHKDVAQAVEDFYKKKFKGTEDGDNT
jgi:hypothetical protein